MWGLSLCDVKQVLRKIYLTLGISCLYVKHVRHKSEDKIMTLIESFWATLKRGYQGTYHKMSAKHLSRYITEFAGRHNARDYDTIIQMEMLAKGI